MTGHLVSNKNQGLWKYYYPDSSMESQGYFKDDIPEGKWTWYYDKGGIKGTGSFVSGKREGEWIDFDKKGKITLKKIFKNGIEVKSKKVKKKSDKI
jgi:antitoxin component YwqK of YwqJK toxin-antitoxin module